MRMSTSMMAAALLAVGFGCGDDADDADETVRTTKETRPSSALRPDGTDDQRGDAGVSHDDAQGACSLVCEGERWSCERTDEAGCSRDAFATVPRCLYELTWAADESCGSDHDERGDAGVRDDDVQGACSLVCEGELWSCQRTDEAGCSRDAFATAPRCLYELTWVADASCGSDDSTHPTVCEPGDCGAPPELQPMACDDGTSIVPSVSCEAEANGACVWRSSYEPCPDGGKTSVF